MKSIRLSIGLLGVILLLLVLSGCQLSHQKAGNVEVAADSLASQTPYPTYTSYPTYTPYPTFTPTPLSPTDTPYPTNTPYPTYTPYPTFTPTATSTSTPAPTPTSVPCNPSWRDIKKLEVPIDLTQEEVADALRTEIMRFSRVDYLPDVERQDVKVYITYMSPQLLEAVAIYAVITGDGKKTQSEVEKILQEINDKLQTDNAIPFAIMIVGNDDRDTIKLGKLEENMVLINQRQEEFHPLVEYTPMLSKSLNMAFGGAEGYVLFPRSTGNKCHPTVNILNDHSFEIRLDNISGTITVGRIQFRDILGEIVTLNDRTLAWSFSLFPGAPLREIMPLPIPKRIRKTLEKTDIDDLVAMTLHYIVVVVP